MFGRGHWCLTLTFSSVFRNSGRTSSAAVTFYRYNLTLRNDVVRCSLWKGGLYRRPPLLIRRRNFGISLQATCKTPDELSKGSPKHSHYLLAAGGALSVVASELLRGSLAPDVRPFDASFFRRFFNLAGLPTRATIGNDHAQTDLAFEELPIQIMIFDASARK
ncbi:unnamed protein product [Caenorhabditis auriculariae]|uniref:Uncharacterized protein n=1 Tax=Caenorhabditis auriculariae TaxID=2777116 RepID=A0A8S1H9W7_9PELO|nr:unnamed protein product [Caenorhabditis auriculariae]